MSVYNASGEPISTLYSSSGSELQQAYDINGNELFSGGSGDYDHWDTEYQHTILQARDAWKTEYRADDDVVPLMLSTDQHSRLKASTKPTFDYLGLAVKWSEVSAMLALGDVCGNLYNLKDLNNMLSALEEIPADKKICLQGNHDNWLTTNDPIDDTTFTEQQENFFNNSAYNGHSKYGNRGMEVMIDAEHKIKYLCIQCFYFTGGKNYTYSIPEGAMTWVLQQMSTVDNYDIVILSHIQPLGSSRTWYYPAVDGNEASSTTKTRNFSGVAPYGSTGLLQGLAHARKNKLSGTITDSDGVTHSYDFSNCTSDLLCWLCGHAHTDSYSYDVGDVPVLIFDAYTYANYPIYMVNIDRTRSRVNVWKIDEANHIYNYQVPFTEPSNS